MEDSYLKVRYDFIPFRATEFYSTIFLMHHLSHILLSSSVFLLFLNDGSIITLFAFSHTGHNVSADTTSNVIDTISNVFAKAV